MLFYLWSKSSDPQLVERQWWFPHFPCRLSQPNTLGMGWACFGPIVFQQGILKQHGQSLGQFPPACCIPWTENPLSVNRRTARVVVLFLDPWGCRCWRVVRRLSVAADDRLPPQTVFKRLSSRYHLDRLCPVFSSAEPVPRSWKMVRTEQCFRRWCSVRHPVLSLHRTTPSLSAACVSSSSSCSASRRVRRKRRPRRGMELERCVPTRTSSPCSISRRSKSSRR